MSTGVQMVKVALLVLAAGLLGIGCIPVNIPYTISLGETNLDLPLEPGTEIGSNIPMDPIEIPCDQFSTDTIQETIRSYAGDFVASLVHLDEVRLVNMEMSVLAPADGTFVGLTKVALLKNGEEWLFATADDGITGGEVVLVPKTTLNLLDLLADCPISLGIQMEGRVPQVLPTRWASAMKVEIRGRVGL